MMASSGRTVLAVLFGALAVAFVAAGCSGSGDDDAAAPEPAAAAPAEGRAADQFAAAEPAAEQALSVSGGAGTLPAAGPQVIQTAFLQLTVSANDFEEVVSRVRTVVGSFNGFVTSSSTSQNDGSALVRGTLVVRVPAAL